MSKPSRPGSMRVEDDDVEGLPRLLGEPLLAGAHARHEEAPALQVLGGEEGQPVVVFDEQGAGGEVTGQA